MSMIYRHSSVALIRRVSPSHKPAKALSRPRKKREVLRLHTQVSSHRTAKIPLQVLHSYTLRPSRGKIKVAGTTGATRCGGATRAARATPFRVQHIHECGTTGRVALRTACHEARPPRTPTLGRSTRSRRAGDRNRVDQALHGASGGRDPVA